MKVYGLEKCDTCKKTRNWLSRHQLAHEFIDYRDHRVPAETLKQWAMAVGGWEKLVNRASTTWRGLPEARKSPASAPEWTLLIKEYPALVRRPVVVTDAGEVSVGFNDKQFAQRFVAKAT
ncbi:Spx/MgsR family RNA polymerase-binding regulatory protein [Tahibacter amnicola]|uniref:Spx/MgsR family RNA polymerase-binding regulatory protein n=1 Tax=Tahibacter amnicola TaxID=2976241 RepID=A0ABY6BAS8_9GAMM|nr:Spx/MgsR family RNA polymerase-binding regulatory protein [Tahibacter amnicola]UXI66789.1 Spx/MgsR family RNA polymerase-binding regulatory protein [Tahibacter amnicola]